MLNIFQCSFRLLSRPSRLRAGVSFRCCMQNYVLQVLMFNQGSSIYDVRKTFKIPDIFAMQKIEPELLLLFMRRELGTSKCLCRDKKFKAPHFSYSPPYNLTPPISRVLDFGSLTSPTCCNSPRKCTPVKYKKRQNAGFPIFTQTPSCYENIGQKHSKIIKSQETDRPWTDKTG